MGPPIRVGVALCLLFIVGGSFAGPLLNKDEPECFKGLPVGKTFVYQYAGVSKIENDDVNQEVNFSADVVVSVPRECVLGVQLRNVVSPHQKFVDTLQNDVVEVRMDNGVIKGLKHNPTEPVWALNVKRAILSMLQTPLDARDGLVDTNEKDVLGICKTNYVPQQVDGDNVVIQKTKNLLSCEARTKSTKAIFFTPYDAPLSDIRTTPVADGEYSCENVISKTTGVVVKATCQQKEKLLLSQQASATPGVISLVTSEASLELLREESGAQNIRSATYRSSCLVFDHHFEHEQSRESLVSATNRFCEAMKPDVRPESGKLFGDLIKSMRSASVARISEVYNSLDSKPCDTKKLKSAFLDVLGMAGSTGSVEMIAKFIENGEHKEHHQKWLKSLAYLTTPTQEMVSAMIPVVQAADEKTAKEIFLPVSAMANTLCKLQHDECEHTAAIKQLVSVLVKKLDNECSGDREIVVPTLKALGNLGVNGGYNNKIMQCMNNKPTDLRMYTLRAFRKVCDTEITQQMLALYADQDEDVEVRIGAYLNAMRCADFDTVAKIVSVYESEKVIQVGSFVYSHMRVIHESECPLKADLKRLIASFPVSAKFSNDPSKFSQNFEYSKFMDSVNMGGVADASVVFSPKSFLPRSASLNLSLDLFSQSVNILELGGRVEGLEKIFEQFLGRNDDHSSRRGRRATKDDTDVARFDKDFKNEIATDEKMSFYVNMFGNEIDYVEFNSFKDLTEKVVISAVKVASMHPSMLLSNLVLQGEVDIAKNALLVDNTISTATISGLGLVLDMRAVSNVHLKASAPVPTETGVMKASLEPSAVVQVDGSLTLSAGVFRHGARFTSTIHTSSVVDIEVTRTSSEFKFRFNTPRDKIEILNAKSEVYAIQGDYETPIAAKNVRNLDGCTTQLPEILGMSACIQGTVPKPWYMAKRGFVKPYNFALTLEKTDKTMEGIEFSVQRTFDTLSFVLDTPGSQVDRRREIHFQATMSGRSIRGQCPQKTFYFGFSTMDEEFIVFKSVDKKTQKETEYALKIRNGLGSVFVSSELNFEARCPHLQKPLTLTIKALGRETEVTSNYPLTNPLKFTAVFDDKSYNTTISAGELEASTKFFIMEDRDISNWHSIFHTTYKLGEKKAQKFHYELKLKGEDVDNGRHRSGLSTWTSTCHPQYNHKIAFDSQVQSENRKHKVQAWWGENFNDDKTIRLSLDSKKKGSWGYGGVTTIQMHSQIFSPAWGLNYDANFDHKIDLQKTPRMTAELHIASDKKTLVKFDYTFDRHNQKSVARASLIAPNTYLKLMDDSEELSKGKYKGTTNIEWGFEGKKLTIDYTCDILMNGNHDVKLNIRAPNMKPIQHRQLVRIARDVQLKTETIIDGKEYLVFEIMKEDQSLAFNFIGQKVQINYARNVKDKAVDVKLDIHSKVYYTRPISLVIHKDSPGKRSHVLNVDFKWDAVANPDKKLTINLNTDREDGVKSHVKITAAQYADFEYKGVYVKGFIKGPNRAEFRLSGANFEARELIVGHEHSTPKGEGYLKYTRGGKPLMDAKVGHEFTSEKRHYYLTMTGVVNRKLTITRDLVARTLKVDLDRDGKLYSLFVDRKTDYSTGVIDCKITLNLPYEQYKSQELTVKGTIGGGKIDLTVHFLSSTNKNYHFEIKGTRPEKLVLDVEISIKSDNEKLKEGKAHLKYNLAHPTDREIILTVDREATRVFDFDLKSKKTDTSKEIIFKLKSEFTPAYEGSMKMDGTPQKFTSKTSITKNGEPYYTADNEFENTGSKMVYKGKYHGGILGGDTEIAFEKNTLPGDNHRTYKLDIKRNDRELKADAETQRSDGFKITSVNVCRTPLDSNCVSVTVKRNIVNFNVFRNNAINVKIHRKPDVTLEIDGQLHIPADVHKAHVRLVGNVNEFKLGVDYHCDHSTEQLSEQQLRGYIVDRELLATRRREQTDKFIDIKYTATFDSKSEEKLEATYRRDYNEKGYSSVAKLSHPKMRTPVVLKCEVSKGKDANSLIRLESQLEFFKPEDTIYFHFERRMNDEIARNRSVHVHIHKADKQDFNLHLTLYRSEDLQKPVFAGYYWSYITAKKETRVGTMKAFLGEDLKGSIEFTSPYQDDFKITGEAKVINADGDKEAEIVHLKNDVETKGKISYNVQKLYMKAVILNADGSTKRELEVDGGRKEKGRYKLVLSSFPEGKRTTDLGIEHTRSSETSFHSRVYMPPEYLKRVAERAKEIAASRAGKYPIEDMKEELKTRTDALGFRIRKTFEDVPEYLLAKVSQIFVEIQGSLTRLINNTTVGQRLKAKFEANREKIGQLMQKFLDFVRSCCPQVAERLEKIMEKYLPKRVRRSVEDEQINLVEYIAERIEMLQKWLRENPVYRKINEMYDGVRHSICELFAGLKRRFLRIPDVKQIAETWAELYDSSSVGHMLPREALLKYVIKPRLEQYAPRMPNIEVDRKAGRFVADVDVPVDASKLVQYWAYGAEPREQQAGYEKHDFSTAMKMVRKTLTRVHDGQANVIDGKHFITFDGKHFSAAGSCSYLLARDFVNGSFSIILKNTGDVPSYVVQFGSKYFEISNDAVPANRITLNGEPFNTPSMKDGVFVFRSNSVITLSNGEVKFVLNTDTGVATINTRIWFFGRTAGLLGNYNREPSDDFKTPTGAVVADESAFLKAWETETCGGETVLYADKTEDVEAVELCDKIFKSEHSSLSLGFLLRRVDEYHDLCLRAAHSASDKIHSGCQVAYAYLQDIERYANLPGYLGARLPDECRKYNSRAY